MSEKPFSVLLVLSCICSAVAVPEPVISMTDAAAPAPVMLTPFARSSGRPPTFVS
jgi:hypothetical protein